MKTVILTLVVLSTVLTAWLFRPMAGVPEKFDPNLAQARGARAAKLAAHAAAPGVGASNLGATEVEKRIEEIDALIGKEKLVEKSNLGTLSDSELVELRRLLGLRNEYFSRKLDLDLGGKS